VVAGAGPLARRHPILRGLAILAALCAGLAVVTIGTTLLGGGSLADRLAFGSAVGVVEVRGVIRDATEVLEALERFRKRSATVAVVLRIDSPGGAVAPAQEIYDAVWRLRDRKPVIASLGNVAASGGYYVASAANVILADPGTITGSIGAIMSVPLYGPLAEKLGVSEEVVKSGRFKDTGHPLRPMTADERALLQGMVDDVLAQFVDAVARGRNMDPARVRELADGRVYSGAQARAAGLVDRLGGLDDATRLAWEQGGQTGEPRVLRELVRRRPWWVDLLTTTFVSEPRGLDGGLLFLYQGPHPE
jgi:protease-4